MNKFIDIIKDRKVIVAALFITTLIVTKDACVSCVVIILIGPLIVRD